LQKIGEPEQLEVILNNPILKKEYELLNGIRGKYFHGLFDLSASLLEPLRPTITEQLNALEGKLSWSIVFAPVPLPEDLVVFSMLSKLAKKARATVNRAFYARVQEWRRKFTRIMLAEEKDMHCGLVDLAEKDAPLRKFRYGTGLVTEDIVEMESVSKITGKVRVQKQSIGRLTEDIMRRRQMDAVRYPVILERQREARKVTEAEAPEPLPTGPAAAQAAQGQIMTQLKSTGYNEIIIAYRQHESGRFSVYSIWDGEKRGFICNAESELTFIPDDWATMPE
jgi:hypothetical protein